MTLLHMCRYVNSLCAYILMTLYPTCCVQVSVSIRSSKTHFIMEMNKEMERYGKSMGMYFEKRGVDSGRSLSLAHKCIFELCLKKT